MSAYYNEIDPYAAQWLRNLIADGRIAPGDVDERDIKDVKPDDLKHYTQCHFFAGIGIWSLALRGAGWPDDRPVWTGSCPCQPFSAAGGGTGIADERHLWPHWHYLIEQNRPATILGEQVASKDGLGWFDLVSADLEGSRYTSGFFDLCAAGFGAPHIRQRLFFGAYDVGNPPRALADSDDTGPQGRIRRRTNTARQVLDGHAGRCRPIDELAEFRDGELAGSRDPGRDADRASQGHLERLARVDHLDGTAPLHARALAGFWRDSDWLFCKDDKWRPVEPGAVPLVDGLAGRLGRVRAYGNAIVAPVAQSFIEAFDQTLRGIAAGPRDRGAAFVDPEIAMLLGDLSPTIEELLA